MGFRFRKQIKILPGVKINLSKKGFSSISIGKPGATVNISKNGTKATVGIPGTGMSYQKRLDKPASNGMTECPFCGHKMRKQWDACPECGSVLVQQMTKEEIIANLTSEERQAAYERGKKKVKNGIITFILALVFVLSIGSCMGDTSDTSASEGQSLLYSIFH